MSTTWATEYIAQLKTGATVSFRPRGGSMSPRIESGQLCTVRPIAGNPIQTGEVVLCRVNGRDYLHFVKAIAGGRFLIGNNKGRVNGWITGDAIFGVLLGVEP